MARHKLTVEERRKGIRSLLKSPKVGRKAKAGLRRALDRLGDE